MSPFYLNNFHEIVARGGGTYGNDGFIIEACTSCGYQFLYNDEVWEIYFLPNDLANSHYDYVQGNQLPPCPGCGTCDFKTETLNDEILIKQGPWAWAV